MTFIHYGTFMVKKSICCKTTTESRKCYLIFIISHDACFELSTVDELHGHYVMWKFIIRRDLHFPLEARSYITSKK